MIHSDDHDPTVDWQRCWTCHQALSASFVTLADMDLGPDGSGRLVEILRVEAMKATDRFDVPLPTVARSKVYDWAEWGDFDGRP